MTTAASTEKGTMKQRQARGNDKSGCWNIMVLLLTIKQEINTIWMFLAYE